MFAVDEFASRTVMRTTRTRTLRLRKSEEGEERRDRHGGGRAEGKACCCLEGEDECRSI
jgi:hypothetical protein